MTLQELYIALLVGGVVVLVSIVATRLAAVAGLPSLLIFLGLGVLLGHDVLGLNFDNVQTAQDLGTAALAVILVEGGLTTRWSEIRAVVAPAGVLGTVGVGVSAAVTAVGAHLLLGFDWQLAFLFGAILSSTDAAAVFAILRIVPLPKRVVGLLEAESGFNDAPAVILVVLLSTVPLHVDPLEIVLTMAYELGAGAAIGLAFGFAGAFVLPRLALPASGLYPLAIFGIGMVAFAAAGSAHASGFLAAYLCALVLANTGLPHRAATRSFAEGLGWLAQIGLFVLLGLLVDPSELGPQILPALLIGLVVLLLARPASVFASLMPFRVPVREQIFLSFAGLRGAVPIVLSTFPIVAGIDGSVRVLNIVFVLVVLFTLVQGPNLSPFAKWLRIAPKENTRRIDVESAPLDVLDAELLTVTIHPGSRLDSVSILELRLPERSVITLIIREGNNIVPERSTRLRTGDEMLIVTSRKQREQTERRLRAVSRKGSLARWFGEYGETE
ncbi:MAG: potassium/proton antiporter [Jatrophihabitans sp.]